MRIALHHRTRFRNAHQFKQTQGFGARRRGAGLLMQANRLGDLVSGSEHRIQRGHRLLENHRHVSTAHGAHLRGIRASKVNDLAAASAQCHRTADHAPAAVLDQTHQRQRGHRFARTRFSDNCQCFAAIDMERKSANGVDGTFGSGKPHAQSIDLNDAISGDSHRRAHVG